jgi:diaminohydroxyphosphoribosylaminopyrimidine deaminase/5-amino-6-(5-phosphoribosylamino)uracil reductase
VSERDREYMRRALALAERGWGQTAPNPMVGAVVVRDGEIVGEGYHERFGAAHAEVNALTAAGARAQGAHVYVTLEPCAHHGKTPPCADALVAAGVAGVTIAAPDPTFPAAGGARRLDAAGIDVTLGLEQEAAVELNAPFFHAATASRPWVTLKLAVSREGAIAPLRGRRHWFSGDPARAAVHRMRANSDAIAVGIGTVLADDPLLTVRHADPPRVQPVRVVFDRRARLPRESQLARTARSVPTIVLAERAHVQGADDLCALGVEVLPADSLDMACEELFARGVRSVMLEGGAELADAFLKLGLVHRLALIRTPVELSDAGVPAFPGRTIEDMVEGLRVVSEKELGADVISVYAVRELSQPTANGQRPAAAL